ncbi:hypothetical protein LCGC14_0912340 [marine sediment metagenome]|uniref:Uncharacterized protein n=1 Tax=marine sediment metagenome TaxID=412755 RepID=A0A0F9PE24_9ZZZZ
MKIKIYKTIHESGQISFDIDDSDIPFSKIDKEFEQEIEIDESKWKENTQK